jgi:hypothetical protein
MSTNDFEVHPRGTSEELRVVRQFVKEISDQVNAGTSRDELKYIVAQMNLWYVGHNERYPNV